MQKNTHLVGIVLKRSDVGEADRVVTLFTREYGKIVGIAKGCRKLTSSRASALEPGVLSRVYMVSTKGMPILTQSTIIDDFSQAKYDLTRIRRVFEVLEMLDSLLQEGDVAVTVFDTAIRILSLLCDEHVQTQQIRIHLLDIVSALGFHDVTQDVGQTPLRDFVEEITQKRLHAYAYLTQD